MSVFVDEAIFFADDSAAEVVKAFKSGKLSFGVDDIGITNAQDLTGASVDNNGVLVSASEDLDSPVAVGFRALKANCKYRYFWLHKVQFGAPATSLQTKGDSISFQTPTIEDTIMRRNKLDGKIAKAKEGINYPPLHPNDRCTTVVHFDGEDLSKFKRRARDPKTGKTHLVPGDMTYEQWRKGVTEKNGYDIVKASRNSKRDAEQYERYNAVLGKENVPESLEEFQRMKYNSNSGKWSALKGDYRTVNQYEIEGNVDAKTIIELDRVASQTRKNGFDYTGLSGKARRAVQKVITSGNSAAMRFDGKTFYSHSRVGFRGTPEYNSYIGEYSLVGLSETRRFETLNLNDGIPREYDTEAKFLEYVTAQKQPNEAFDVTILSEKHICESCSGVVDQFRAAYPNAAVNIVSGKEICNNYEEELMTWLHKK